MPEKATKAGKPDWERIELDYRAGIKTLRQIADENGITHGAINKRAKRDDWTRDLSEKINAKADALVSKAAVSTPVSTESKIAERQVVEANAHAVADVRLAHRRDIHRARRLTNALLDELEQETHPETVDRLRKLGEFMLEPDDRTGRDKLNELYQAVITLPERSKTMKVLAESLQKLVDMERIAFGMDREAEKTMDPLSALLYRISTANSSTLLPVEDDPEAPEAPAAPAIGGGMLMPREDVPDGDW